jgi:hypothetical protein
MEPPIIAWEPNDMSVYDTVKEAETHLEPWMCEFTSIFDRQGRQLVLEEGHGWRAMNKLREVEPGKADEAGLRQALVQYLAQFDIHGNLNGCSTDDLIAMATPFAAVSKPRLGVLADSVLDFLRWVGGKRPKQPPCQ